MSEDIPAYAAAAFCQSDADDGADDSLGTGDRHQRQGRQVIGQQKGFQFFGGEKIKYQ